MQPQRESVPPRILAGDRRTPQEYLNELRIAMAVSLLRGGTLTLSEVAAECGYPTLSSFNRQFRRQRGSSPGRFRRSLAGETP